MAARSVKATLVNQADRKLVRAGEPHLDHGEWITEPPGSIDPGTNGEWKSESNGVATGTEGWVEYTLGGVDGKSHFGWNNPFVGSNSYDHSAPPGYVTDRSGGGGNDATVKFYIKKA